MHYLITGATGFKGSWLTTILLERGHKVSGISLDPQRPNNRKGIFELANLTEKIKLSGGVDLRFDIRDQTNLTKQITQINPDVLIHFAAQPLVRQSYRNPRETFETNIMGTYNCLEAANLCDNLKAQLIITTDKVYKNYNKIEGYLETDELGCNPDPYSSSKSCADILTQCILMHPDYRIPTAIARGGNVIGGGDNSEDRLFVDLIFNALNNNSTVLRNPNATRPWQHVLDCLNGYDIIVENLLNNPKDISGEIFNVAPETTDLVEVNKIVDEVSNCYYDLTNSKMHPCEIKHDLKIHEAQLLSLNPSKIKHKLNYMPKYDYRKAVQKSVEWYLEVFSNGADAYDVTVRQINDYYKLLNV